MAAVIQAYWLKYLKVLKAFRYVVDWSGSRFSLISVRSALSPRSDEPLVASLLLVVKPGAHRNQTFGGRTRGSP